MFKVNELVMYGATGVCKVIKIGRPDFIESEEERLYYFLEPLYQNGMIYAPIDNDTVKIRPVISAEEATSLLDSLDEVKVDVYRGRSMQQLSQHYQSILDTHNCRSILSMTKSIFVKSQHALRNNKRIGQIDKRFMKRAEELLFGEIAVALDTDRDKVEEYVHGAFRKHVES